ncbi:bifunctional GNAT family N-acetyltransferase/carbon-nitrogen hydrolase family protein [Marinoscillum sp. MHG1-6]|uniref:bifunctional GNAT family N-acetyltransferase/carbon-nitrogen hydrolase family protein n=1 Tax=Marinoscillum sp. MHG1-6 TaxID=2959627 RepID=UPI0021586E89|nr:bifunctional GNAT family N-acetyltransferase/carbon-nitrogen hydrolase family protein [Marinoscillum sp. MHG1-6]
MTKQKNPVAQEGKSQNVHLRHLQLSDYPELRDIMTQVYGKVKDPYWERMDIKRLLEIFPEGQLCIELEGKMVAVALAIIVDYKKYGDNHTYQQITGGETFSTHDALGDVLYGIDVFVHPEYRGLRLGRRLYDGRKELCENLNLKSILAGGRIPNYAKHANELTPRQYIIKVRNGEIKDPILNFQLSNDFHVKKVLKNYLPGDTQSKDFATLLEWNNIYFQENEALINVPRTYVRIGLVQWQMRPFADFDALVEQMEYFIDAFGDYQSDFILFPELFNAPLMAEFNQLGTHEAIRGLAKYTEPLREKFTEFAISYNVNIITGSMPETRGDHLYNVSYLCRRDGSWDSTSKIHITPGEASSWGMTGGDKVEVFDTDAGKIGILICYDVEFPELSRIYAEQGLHILFVPFLTDTQNGFNRVRYCAQARAIENECYVAIAGCVGNLPKVNNMDIQYAQSAIFTPSDFAFPTNAIKAEATPNTEMTVIGDVDLELLKELHEFGSVRNLKDRRNDLYQVKIKK